MSTIFEPINLIWAIGLMESWFCIWGDLVNPNNGINLVPNLPYNQNVSDNLNNIPQQNCTDRNYDKK